MADIAYRATTGLKLTHDTYQRPSTAPATYFDLHSFEYSQQKTIETIEASLASLMDNEQKFLEANDSKPMDFGEDDSTRAEARIAQFEGIRSTVDKMLSLLKRKGDTIKKHNEEKQIRKAEEVKRAALLSARPSTALGAIGKENQSEKSLAGKAALAGPRHTLGDVSNRALSTAGKKAEIAPAPSVVIPIAIPVPDLNEAVEPVKRALVTPPSPGVDAADRADAQKVSVFAKDIFEHIITIEARDLPRKDYMSTQTDINPKMRAILVDWLVDVHIKFKLSPETLFLCVNIMDRFLSQKVVSRQKLQLVGATALLLASKYEEIYAPQIADFIFICAKAYTREDILRMERIILSTLNFNLTTATPFPFIKRYAKVSKADEQTQALASYFVELCMLEYDMVATLPSLIAGASFYLARKFMRLPAWDSVLQYYSKYEESQLKATASQILALVRKADTNQLQAIRKKYQTAKFQEVAKIPPSNLAVSP